MSQDQYDPALWGPRIAPGMKPEPKLPKDAKCDNHPERFAFNLAIASDGRGDVYLCRDCFLKQRPTEQRHPQSKRRS
jgi:hypothetical protein